MDPRPKPARPHLWLRGALLAALAALVGLAVFSIPWRDSLIALPELVQAAGAWGPLILGAVYVVASMVFVPGSLLTIAAGYTLGLLEGAVTVSVASTVGAAAAFLMGRFLVRGWIIDKAAHGPKFCALDEAIRQQGFKIVLLVRLSPFLPFAMLNYSLGVSRIAFRDFILASWVGMLPATFAYVYIGTSLRALSADLTQGVEDTPVQRLFFWVGLAATLAVAVLLTRIARNALRAAMAVPSEHADTPEHAEVA